MILEPVQKGLERPKSILESSCVSYMIQQTDMQLILLMEEILYHLGPGMAKHV